MTQFENLIERFSGRAFEIRRRLRDDEGFRELCEDYEAAMDALAYWRASDRQTGERARDYQDLVSELETEILTTLGNAKR